MPYKKGQSGNPKGKPKGTRNKISSEIRDYILQIDKNLRKKGKGLQTCAVKDPHWFYEKIYVKIIPKPVDVSGEIDAKVILMPQAIEKPRDAGK